jgi:sRNA-binding regulator protein Hfq
MTHSIEHVDVHVGVNGKVRQRVVASFDKYTVALSHGDGQHVHRETFRVDLDKYK